MYKPHRQNVEWKKPYSKPYMLYGFIYRKNPKRQNSLRVIGFRVVLILAQRRASGGDRLWGCWWCSVSWSGCLLADTVRSLDEMYQAVHLTECVTH